MEKSRTVRVRSGLDRDLPGIVRGSEPGHGMEEIFLKGVFPALSMERWIATMISALDEDEVTTFGSLATALGEPRAARAVGEILSRGVIPDSHRVVYSDGRLPGSKDRLKSFEGIELAAEDPPFPILREIQRAMEGITLRRIDPGSNLVGTDISCDPLGCVAALCLTDSSGSLLGETDVRGDLPFPYVPGYLFYREAPLLVPLLRKARAEGLMDNDPLILIDGNGKLHPRRMGIAMQLGIVSAVPTCGVAKRLHLGNVGEWADRTAPVHFEGEVLGTAIRNGMRKPIYVSEGTGPALQECVKRVRACLKGSNPEPLVRAHRSANSIRKCQNP